LRASAMDSSGLISAMTFFLLPPSRERSPGQTQILTPLAFPALNPCIGRERDPCGEIPLYAFLPFGVEVQLPPTVALGSE
jgi:hypothetical protein